MSGNKGIAVQFRQFLKAEGIKAGLRMPPNHKGVGIQLYTKNYGDEFTSDEIYKFTAFAKSIGAVGVRHTEIEPEHEAVLTGKITWNFYFHNAFDTNQALISIINDIGLLNFIKLSSEDRTRRISIELCEEV